MNKARFKELFRMNRAARRNPLDEGCTEMFFATVRTLRRETGRFLSFPYCGYGRVEGSAKPVRTSSGRTIYRLAGPYRCGRRGALSH